MLATERTPVRTLHRHQIVRARVLTAMQDRVTPVDRRALVTLDRALLEVPAHD